MKVILIILSIIFGSSGAYAGWLALQAVNNTIPVGGFLLDNSAGFLTTPYPGKILAR